jgi:type I restriction enzyme S subunit
MKLRPYPKYKDSGIKWIGEIPEGWEVNKIKNTSYVKGRIGWHGLTSEEYSDEGAYLVTGTDFKDGVIEWDDCHHVGWDRYKEDPYIHLKEDDLLITKDGTIGKIALIKILPNKATLNSGIFLVRPLNKKYIPKFMYWMLNSAVFERFFDFSFQSH